MIEIADKLASVLTSGNVLWLVIFSATGIVFHFQRIKEFLDAYRKRRVVRLVEALQCEHLDDSFKEFLKQELNNEYWNYVTDVHAENKFRESILSLYREVNGEFPFSHFRRAKRHIKFIDGKLDICIKWHDTLGYYLNMGVAITFGFVGLVICLSSAFIKPMSLPQLLSLIGVGMVLIVVALFSLSETSSVFSAKVIRKFMPNKSI